MSTLCVGMMTCDIPLTPIPSNIMNIDKCSIRIPKPSSGGDALNVAIGLGKLGEDVEIIGRIGRDSYGDFIKSCALASNVKVDNVVTDPEESTAISYVLIDETGERHFISSDAIFHKLCIDDIPIESIKKTDIVYFGSSLVMDGMDYGGTAMLFKKAHEQGALTAMDAAVNPLKTEGCIALLEDALYETDLFMPSYEEAVLLTGKKNIDEIRQCFQKYNLKILIIKLGSKGCYTTDFIEEQYAGVYPKIKVVDTDGAGDSFVAGFLYAYGHSFDAFDSAIFANGVAAKNVSVIGTSEGVPNASEAFRYYKENCNLIVKSRTFL